MMITMIYWLGLIEGRHLLVVFYPSLNGGLCKFVCVSVWCMSVCVCVCGCGHIFPYPFMIKKYCKRTACFNGPEGDERKLVLVQLCIIM